MTAERKTTLIEAYAETCNVTVAARRAGVGRRAHYSWLEEDSNYAEAFRKVRVQAGEYLEGVGVDRATKGWLEPVYYQGARCGSVRRYDGGLLQFLLRGLLPEKYGQKTEISGPQGAPLQAKVEVVFVKPQVSD